MAAITAFKVPEAVKTVKDFELTGADGKIISTPSKEKATYAFFTIGRDNYSR